MNKRMVVLVTGLLVVVALGGAVWSSGRKDISHRATNTDFIGTEMAQATVKGTCAPSKGPAISFETEYKSKKLSVSVFEKGLELLETGRRVVIINKSETEQGTGIASLCSSKRNCFNYGDGQVTVLNPTGVFNKEGSIELMITIDAEYLPVVAEWDKTPARCN